MRLPALLIALALTACPEIDYDDGTQCYNNVRGHCFCSRLNGYEQGFSWAPHEVCDDWEEGNKAFEDRGLAR